MAFSRNSVAAAVAGTLSLAALTGCPAPTTTQPSASPSAGATAAPTTAPTATTAPSTAPTTGASGAPTAAPSTTPSASTLAATTVQGKVYDETGALVNTGAKIMIKSLNPSNPFETTVDVVNGNYVANNVPAGVLVEITAMRDGYTSRTKVENLLPLASVTAGGNQVNFGGPLGTAGTQEDPYFIAKFPEVTSTEPVDEADLADPTQLTYKLTLSEALDATNQRRFAQALRIWPMNSAAVADGTSSYVSTSTGGAVTPAAGVATPTALTIDAGTVTPTATSYVVQEGVSFNTDSNLATVTWDAAGKVATLSFRAPLKASSASKAIYAVGLVSGGTTERIVDASGDQLGLDVTAAGGAAGGALTAGSQTSYPTTAGNLVADVFRKATLPTLSTPSVAAVTDSVERWAATHNSVSRFNVAEDDTAPVLQSATVTGGNVISLTFSEPLVAFGGTGVYLVNGALTETNYVIRLAEKLDDLSSEKLDTGAVAADTAAGSTANTRLASLALNTNYTLTVADFDIKVSETDPKVLLLRRNDFINQAGDKFRVTAKAVKVRVSTAVKDPAGNAVQSSNDANLKATNI